MILSSKITLEFVFKKCMFNQMDIYAAFWSNGHTASS